VNPWPGFRQSNWMVTKRNFYSLMYVMWWNVYSRTYSYNKTCYHIFCCNMFVFACQVIARSQCWLFALRENIRIGPQIFVLALKHPYLIQDNVYIWTNYSVSSYLNFIPIF
jgi:hypothetical protein